MTTRPTTLLSCHAPLSCKALTTASRPSKRLPLTTLWSPHAFTGSLPFTHFTRSHNAQGFCDILPKKHRALITAKELQQVLHGVQKIDVDSWEHHCSYEPGYLHAPSPSLPLSILRLTSHLHTHTPSMREELLRWFWRCVRAMTEEQRRSLLQFWSGSKHAPLFGFDTSEEEENFNIEPHYDGSGLRDGSLVTAATWYCTVALLPFTYCCS